MASPLNKKQKAIAAIRDGLRNGRKNGPMTTKTGFMTGFLAGFPRRGFAACYQLGAWAWNDSTAAVYQHAARIQQTN
ncbi:hypothetical protein [Bradyrhizobium canariense]|uniref:hypothetical protein n=1 Tax=Bradyrhizobium canariense TaxID=255045 RepID=UPI001431C7C9|nr:hypothetical protein [Bradyrhizobium canariense]